MRAGPPSLLSPVDSGSGYMRAREGGPPMSVYVGIDVHRKRSQIAVVDHDGAVRVNRNVPNGVGTVLAGGVLAADRRQQQDEGPSPPWPSHAPYRRARRPS